MITGRVLNSGAASGTVLKLTAPLSFWGGLDPKTGAIIDRAHPQVGASTTGHILVMPGSRGSAGTPGVLGESIRLGTGPAALIVTKADVNLTAGALVAATLYGKQCPVVLVQPNELDTLNDGDAVSVGSDGTISTQS